MFIILDGHAEPVLRRGTPGTEENKFGFEGGTVIKQDGVYHLFTSEMVGEPMWVEMRLAHWISEDSMHFVRQSTLYTSSGDHTGEDPRAALWSPMPTYDEAEERWSLTYVAYRCGPPEMRASRNREGRIWRAVSRVKGRGGLGGPYEDQGIMMQPGPDSDPWEGMQGTDSFFPYQAGDQWYAFYGSAQTENDPVTLWGVGLARAKSLAGPWERCTSLNPVPIHPLFVENPIVTRLDNGLYVAIYDGGPMYITGIGTFGYSVSRDGIQWSEGTYLHLPEDQMTWQAKIRTPLCLIPEGDGVYTMYYTAMDHDDYGCIGRVRLLLVDDNGCQL